MPVFQISRDSNGMRSLRLTRLVAQGADEAVLVAAWRGGSSVMGVRVAAAKVAAQVAGARWFNAAVVAVEKDPRQQFGGLPIRCLALQPLRPLFRQWKLAKAEKFKIAHTAASHGSHVCSTDRRRKEPKEAADLEAADQIAASRRDGATLLSPSWESDSF
ncbi:mRNA cleavage and polyadenylation factor I/II complex, subunit Pcf11 [Moesziomyces antarcticus T-34]|uniref:mRNA cleavage and polyadenylation factor I/II complex, subunit Pcf11 n=1 Tax=Pseudozyma antarctica (strain T-34) TaxID=1151754 RepID=M9LW29_PSEA3|nr:mRNA cleavage and polyadenylation factor I/II complex, subunit Pcf11 [Moesziomyces antarcticus T-34]